MKTTLSRILLVLLLAAVALVGSFAWLYNRRGLPRMSTGAGVQAIENLVLANPDLEVIEWQRRAEVIKARQRSSGKEVLFTYRDIAGRRTALGFDEFPVDHLAEKSTPAWVPLVPGAQILSSHRDAQGGELELAVPLPLKNSLEFYQRTIRAEAMIVAVESRLEEEKIVRGVSLDGQSRVAAKLIARNNGTLVRLQYAGK